MKNKYLCVGKIVGVRGLCGEIKIEPWSDSPESFCEIKNLYTDIKSIPLKIESLRVHKFQVLAKIEGVNDKNCAENLKGKFLYAFKEDIPIEENSYFIEDLKGCKVFDAENGKEYGILNDVLNTGANDIYVIHASGKEYLLPVIEGTVSKIDLQSQKISVNPIQGVFDDN